jgi:hypothetical protein
LKINYKIKKEAMKKIFLPVLFFIFSEATTSAQNSFPTPTGVVRINEKTANNRLLFQEIVEPNGESLVSMITGQQRGILLKDRSNHTGGLWLIGGSSTSTPTSAGGIGAGLVGDMATYLALAANTSAITFLDGKINFFANKGFSIGQAYYPTPKMMLNADGNLGIGTAGPTRKLHVSGLSDIVTKIEATDDGYASLELTGNNKTWQWSKRPSLNYGDALQLYYFNGTAWSSPFLTFSTGGNMGIGTNAPDAKLAVKGTIHAQEVKVDLSVPGPDYVFEPTYDLKPLSEIETYIKENKHLPEVPSAKEMEANGVQLGEMNMLLLKKVEELTLYVIELNNKNQHQNKEMKQLRDENESLKQVATEINNLKKQIESIKTKLK